MFYYESFILENIPKVLKGADNEVKGVFLRNRAIRRSTLAQRGFLTEIIIYDADTGKFNALTTFFAALA
jgi:hypothetical protein